jgi:hypothetical protein
MNRLLDKYLFSFPRNAAGGAGDGAGDGGAAGAGAGAGAGASGGAGAGAGAAGAAGAAAGGTAAGSGAAAGSAAGSGGSAAAPFWKNSEYGFDDATVRFFDSKNYPDIKTALSSLRHADEHARSRNVIEKPNPEKLQEWNGYSELGWTEDRTKYAVEKPKIADGEKFDDAEFTAFTDIAHKARVAPWQAKAIYDGMHQAANQRLRDIASSGANARRELENKLRTDWGTNFDANKELARRAATFFGKNFTVQQIDALIGSPAAMQMFYDIGAAMGEDKLVISQGDSGLEGMTPGAARAERLKLEADPNWMKIFNDPRHSQQKDYVAQRQRLIDIEAKGGRAA